MKILSASQIREADAYTIRNEPVSSIDLMERAAAAAAGWILRRYSSHRKFHIFCGTGNNGGDGLVIARYLIKEGYPVNVYEVTLNNVSPDYSVNEGRLKEYGISPVRITSVSAFPAPAPEDIIVDALFGSGLTRPADGLAASVIESINRSKAEVISIDIPSGLFADNHSEGPVIQANHTLSFELPKLAFMMPENHASVGEWILIPIGLSKEFILRTETSNYFLTAEDCKVLLHKSSKFDHKGSNGHALLIAGSYGKMGAAILAAEACLRSGAGLVTCHVPRKGYEIIQVRIPEAMVSIDPGEEYFTHCPSLDKFDAIGAGPGIGTHSATITEVGNLAAHVKVPLVLDADALNCIALSGKVSYPAHAIITPHPGEFSRLAGNASDDFERNKMQVSYSVKNNVITVLKGAHTCISFPDGRCVFNSSGNPGMATGGSGDVLTGIMTGLLAQGYSPEHAALLGVYIHGLAGDIAAGEASEESLLAGDLREKMAEAFRRLKE